MSGVLTKKVRAIEIAFGIGGEFVEILLQLPFLGSPSEVV